MKGGEPHGQQQKAQPQARLDSQDDNQDSDCYDLYAACRPRRFGHPNCPGFHLTIAMMAATIETKAISSDATVSQRFTRFSFACSF